MAEDVCVCLFRKTLTFALDLCPHSVTTENFVHNLENVIIDDGRLLFIYVTFTESKTGIEINGRSY